VSHDEMRTGRLTRRLLDLERSMSFWETPSREETLRKVRVMRVMSGAREAKSCCAASS
jgi:hypothetical protein